MLVEREEAFLYFTIWVVKLPVSIDLIFFEPSLKLPSISEFDCPLALFHVIHKWTPVLIIRSFEIAQTIHFIVFKESLIINLERILLFLVYFFRFPWHFTFSLPQTIFETALIQSLVWIFYFGFSLQQSVNEIA